MYFNFLGRTRGGPVGALQRDFGHRKFWGRTSEKNTLYENVLPFHKYLKNVPTVCKACHNESMKACTANNCLHYTHIAC